MKKYFTEIAETPDWELAFVYAIHAWAALSCGKLDDYKVSYHKASLCLEAIKEPEDRAVVLKTFNLIPKMWGSNPAPHDQILKFQNFVIKFGI